MSISRRSARLPVREVNPDITVLRMSARSGEGLDAWYGWLRRRELAAVREATLI